MFEGAVETAAALAMGGDVSATFGGRGIKNKLLSRAAEGQAVDPVDLADALEQVSPTEEIKQQATAVASMAQKLPGILLKAANQAGISGGGDAKLAATLADELKLAGIDPTSAMA